MKVLFIPTLFFLHIVYCRSDTFQPTVKHELKAALNLWISNNSNASSIYGDIDNWDTSLITDMSYLFLDIAFDDPIGSWNVSSVTNMSHMFSFTASFDQDIGSWDVSSVTDMS